jgi:hypothetical protein
MRESISASRKLLSGSEIDPCIQKYNCNEDHYFLRCDTIVWAIITKFSKESTASVCNVADAVGSSEKSVTVYQITPPHIPEHSHIICSVRTVSLAYKLLQRQYRQHFEAFISGSFLKYLVTKVIFCFMRSQTLVLTQSMLHS